MGATVRIYETFSSVLVFQRAQVWAFWFSCALCSSESSLLLARQHPTHPPTVMASSKEDAVYAPDGPEAQRIARTIPYYPFKGIERFYDIGGESNVNIASTYIYLHLPVLVLVRRCAGVVSFGLFAQYTGCSPPCFAVVKWAAVQLFQHAPVGTYSHRRIRRGYTHVEWFLGEKRARSVKAYTAVVYMLQLRLF